MLVEAEGAQVGLDAGARLFGALRQAHRDRIARVRIRAHLGGDQACVVGMKCLAQSPSA
jgi:hypothetical protein